MTIYGTGSAGLILASSIIILILFIIEAKKHKISNLLNLFRHKSH